MKTLDLRQIEISMIDGSVRLVVFRVNDGEVHPTPHLIGIMPDHDPRFILDAVQQHLGGQGYEWIDTTALDRALKHRDIILQDPAIMARNEETRMERDRASAAEAASRSREEESRALAVPAEEKRIQDLIEAAVAKATGRTETKGQ
jgi:hypothetical protein